MPISRRSVLARLSTLAGALLAAPFLGFAQSTQRPNIGTRFQNRLKRKKPAAAAQPFVFFGTDTTKSGAKGIYASRFNPATGQLSPPTLAAACVRPSWFALGASGKRRLLYVCNEGDAKTSAISAYTLDPVGALHLLGQVTSAGAGPCYLSVAATNQSVFIADYSGSSVASYRIFPDGTLSQPVERIDFRDPKFGHRGPNKERQEAPHPHFAMLSPDDRFLLVNDLGSDTIVTFPVDVATAKLGPPHVNERRPGSGPRHLAFHPNGRWIYSVNELDNRVDQLLWNATHGDPARGFAPQALLTDTGRSVSTLDPNFHGANTAAEIAVAPNGRFLYVSNRGEDSLVCFAIEEETGALILAQRIACGGKAPRHFTLDPTAKWLVCGNQDSGSVTVFARNEGNGHLSGPVQTLPLEAPQFTLFA
jgi:6-phosphogluconolactonase